MKFYAYCVSDEIEEDGFEAVEGIAGGATRLVEAEGIGVVVSEFAESSIAVTRENVLAHERVVRHVLGKASLLPFRFGTIIARERLLDFISSQKGALCRQLERVRGCVEMSVKVSLPGEEDAETRGRGDAAKELSGEIEEKKLRGTEYLEKKRREILGDEATRERVEEIERWISERLGSAVRESVFTAKASGSLIFAASYLVERERLDEYRKRLDEARRNRPFLHFLTSGPWPPYSFSDINS